jgi:hypothetical protein
MPPWNSAAWYWQQMANYWFSRLSRYINPTPEQLQESLVHMLSRVEPNSALWFALDRILSDRFKVEIDVVDVDMPAFYNWFNSEIYPVVVAQVDMKLRTCSVSDLKAILRQDFTNHKKYLGEYFDCDDFSLMLRHRLIHVYGINACAEVQTANHAWNIFYDSDGKAWGIEPQTDGVWNLEMPPSEIYDRDRIWYFGI